MRSEEQRLLEEQRLHVELALRAHDTLGANVTGYLTSQLVSFLEQADELDYDMCWQFGPMSQYARVSTWAPHGPAGPAGAGKSIRAVRLKELFTGAGIASIEQLPPAEKARLLRMRSDLRADDWLSGRLIYANDGEIGDLPPLVPNGTRRRACGCARAHARARAREAVSTSMSTSVPQPPPFRGPTVDYDEIPPPPPPGPPPLPPGPPPRRPPAPKGFARPSDWAEHLAKEKREARRARRMR